MIHSCTTDDLPIACLSELSQPIKGHLVAHYPELKSSLGADFIVLDTQQSEKEHKFVGKAAFNRSNKQYGAETKQMCKWVLAVEGSSKLHSEMLRLETKVEVEKLGQDVHTVNKFRSTNGVKSCKLEWNKPLKCWVLPKESVLDPYFHPCLSQQDVFGRLSASYARNPECMMQVWLMQQLRVDPPAASPDPDAWHMQCDRKCKLGSRLARREHSYCSLYSCVTIRSSDGQSPDMLARVLAVLKVKALVSSGEEVETFRFIVGPLVLDFETKGFIPFPIVKHKRDRGEIMFEYCTPSDILFPEFLIPVAGHGIPLGALETAENVVSGLWYHVPRNRVRPSLGGCYEQDFVELECDKRHTIPGHLEDLKVFVSPIIIKEDSDSIGYYEPDQSYSRFKLNERVVVNYNGLNKWWCPGVIIKIDDSPAVALYDVKFDDGEELNAIPETLLRREKERFPTVVIKIYSRVVAKRSDGYWYPGTVTKAETGAEEFSATISCDIHFDEGHIKRKLIVGFIRLECNANRDSAVFMVGSAVQVKTNSGDLITATIIERTATQPSSECAVRIDDSSDLRLVPWKRIRQSEDFFAKQKRRDAYRQDVEKEALKVARRLERLKQKRLWKRNFPRPVSSSAGEDCDRDSDASISNVLMSDDEDVSGSDSNSNSSGSEDS